MSQQIEMVAANAAASKQGLTLNRMVFEQEVGMRVKE